MFFTKYDKFQNGEGYSDPFRLNSRHKAIIEWNESLIQGKKILDIAAHDGRWSFAALKAGAEHVTSIEMRKESFDKLHENMMFYGETNYEAICGDVHDEILKLEPGQFDTIFCLGFFYHTTEHGFLLRQFKRLSPKSIVFDTDITIEKGMYIKLYWESTNYSLNACSCDEKKLVGVPTKQALNQMLFDVGYGNISYYDWNSVENPPSGYPDYRVTLTARKSKFIKLI